MGGIEGRTYTNSLEAWRTNYAMSCRLFELDLWITSDQKLVAFHGPSESDPGLPKGFSHRDFMSRKVFGRYTPLDSDSIAQILAEKRDWKIVTDIKSEDLRPSLELLCASLKRRDIACQERLIPQIYRPSTDLEVVEKMGFPQVIFTIYLTHLGDQEIVAAARANRRIVAVTMPPARATEEMVRSLAASGLRCYVHTVNGREAIHRLFERQIWGVYTDFDCADPVAEGQRRSAR